MNRFRYTFLLLFSMAFFLNISASETIVYKIDIKKEIGSTTWLYTQKGFEEANKKDADMIIIHLNTYGGEVLYADSIRTKILKSDIPVYAFIDNNAASAGALISLACQKIYMHPGSSFGAATVVNSTGEEMPDKYQSYMRATMRATAEAHGKDTIVAGKDTVYKWVRDPLIAEAMVDERTVVPNLIDSGKTLTFTSLEAMEYGYCEGVVNNIDELLSTQLGINDYKLVEFKPTKALDIKGFFMSTVVQGILIMLIIGGIYFEIQTPGVGFPLIVAITAALLYFVPLYIDGLAANWEILIFIIGLILIALEIFVVPGFGITGISGIILVIVGLTLSMVDNVNFNFQTVESGEISNALFTVMVGVFLSFALILYFSSRIGSKGLLHNIALNTNLDKDKGYMAVEMEHKILVGAVGIAYTDLRPSGKVRINNEIYDAVSENKFILKNAEVVVLKYEMGQLYVIEKGV